MTATTASTTSTTTIISAPNSSLHHATSNSTAAWQSDLESLFHRAKDRFPDVVWALLTEEDGEPTGEQVYGHKGMSSTYISPRDLLSRPLLAHPYFPSPPRIAIPRPLTYMILQPSYTLALRQVSRHDIFPSALPPYYLQAPLIHILHPTFPPSPRSLFPLVQKSPPYLAPLRPFAPHLPSLRVKMA